MSEKQNTSSTTRSPGWNLMVWALFLLVVVYPLSTGPTIKVWGRPTPKPLLVIYAPLRELGDRYWQVDKFFTWYITDVWKAP